MTDAAPTVIAIDGPAASGKGTIAQGVARALGFHYLDSGAAAAFDPLFRRLWPLLRGFARPFLSAEEADDVAQEALLRIFRRASEFDPGRDALAWILGVVAWPTPRPA